MNSVRDLHNEAMRLAQLAMVARHAGEFERAQSLALQAYQYEAEAADLVPNEESSEPTRSILYRSAASLAYQSKEFKVAQRLIAKGLSGYPPVQIEQQLRDLYEQVNFEQHLVLRGVTLADEDLQLALQGNVVGSGTILYTEFKKRMDQTHQLIDRTVQRLMGRTYQLGGRIAQIYKPFEPALSVPRIGSFAVTIKLIHPEGRQLPLVPNAAQVIDELLNGIELINREDENSLKDLIQEERYYQNFVSLTRDIAPDGDKINLVGFTSNNRTVALTRKRAEISLVPTRNTDESVESNRESIIIRGILDYATVRQRNVIGLTTDEGKEYDIRIEAGMDDLVISYWRQRVVVTGHYDGRYVYPEDVESSEE